MKKIINKLKSSLLFTFIISGILFGSIGIYAASIYYAKDISYEPSDASWEVSNVNDAINGLYAELQNISDSNSSKENAFTKMFPDYSIDISHESLYTYRTPITNITKEYFESYVHWGKTAKSITGVTNSIDLTNVNSIILDYEAINGQGSVANESHLSFISASGTTTRLINFGHTGRTTKTIDVSTITETGRFQLYQRVGGETNEGYNNRVIIYDIKFQ